MVTVPWITAAILCAALCAYGITTAARRQETAVSRHPRSGATLGIASLQPLPLRPRGAAGTGRADTAAQLSAWPGSAASWPTAGAQPGWEGYRLGTLASAARQRCT